MSNYMSWQDLYDRIFTILAIPVIIIGGYCIHPKYHQMFLEAMYPNVVYEEASMGTQLIMRTVSSYITVFGIFCLALGLGIITMRIYHKFEIRRGEYRVIEDEEEEG